MAKKLLLLHYLSAGDVLVMTAAIRDLHKAYPKEFITDVDTSARAIWENNPHITKLQWKRESFKIELPIPKPKMKATTEIGTLIFDNGLWHHDTDKTKVITDSDPPEKIKNRCKYIIHKEPNTQVIHCKYDLIHSSNTAPYHYIHGFSKELEDKLPWWNNGKKYRIPLTEFKGDIHISNLEKSWMSQIEETGFKGDFWVIMAGGKFDFTTKWWDPRRYQEVVNYFKGRIKFVQCGSQHDWHAPLRDVIDLRGKTDIRQFIRLVYHSSGILCPVTFAMHLAAAVPMKPDKPKHRACVVIAGSREPSHWEAYTHHQFIHNCGALPCAQEGGCWKSRCQKVGDGDSKDENNLCENFTQVYPALRIPKCMDMIDAVSVIRRIETYYEGGAFKYQYVSS